LSDSKTQQIAAKCWVFTATVNRVRSQAVDSPLFLYKIAKTMLVALLYLVLGGAYLVVLPGILYFYLQNRWYVAGSWERTFMYFLVFFFFPGLLLLSPFLNFRPKRRQVEA
jgi:NAD(P)H-quinone oxidoreductase subunit L